MTRGAELPPHRRRSTKTNRAEQRRQTALLAIEHLSRRDARLGRLIARLGPHRPAITPDPFAALVGAIVQQQVSMSAAAAIHGRIKGLCAGRRVTPAAILALHDGELRTAGLSRQKVRYVHAVADAFAAGMLTTRKLRRMSDEEVVAATTGLPGVGRWTAEMLLIFCLERPDVWPLDDLGLRKALGQFLKVEELPDNAALHALAEPWRPYRSYATWYLWRSLEGPFMPGIAL